MRFRPGVFHSMPSLLQNDAGLENPQLLRFSGINTNCSLKLNDVEVVIIVAMCYNC